MRRIIDGKAYDTEKSLEIASDGQGYMNDFHHWEETLHKTQRGAWFLRGSGGALSHWSRETDDNMRGGGCGIRVLTSDEAREWLERGSFTASIDAHFAVEEA